MFSARARSCPNFVIWFSDSGKYYKIRTASCTSRKHYIISYHIASIVFYLVLLEHIISLFNDINLTNTEYLFEEEFGYLLSTEDSLNIDFNLEFDDEYNDAEGSKKDDIWNDTYDFLFSKINFIIV